MATTKQNKFLATALTEHGKTEIDNLTEKVTTFVEDSIIECESQISERNTRSIPSKKMELKRATAELTEENKNHEKLRFSVPSGGSFAAYLKHLNDSKRKIESLERNCENIKNEISLIEKEVKGFESILEDLKATA